MGFWCLRCGGLDAAWCSHFGCFGVGLCLRLSFGVWRYIANWFCVWVDVGCVALISVVVRCSFGFNCLVFGCCVFVGLRCLFWNCGCGDVGLGAGWVACWLSAVVSVCLRFCDLVLA